MGAQDAKIQIYDSGTGRVREERLDEDELGSLPLVSRNVGHLYGAFRKDEWVPTFDWGVVRHEQVQKTWAQFDETQT